MTIDDAIKHCLERANKDCSDCAGEHRQLAMWLGELQGLRISTQTLIQKMSDTLNIGLYKFFRVESEDADYKDAVFMFTIDSLKKASSYGRRFTKAPVEDIVDIFTGKYKIVEIPFNPECGERYYYCDVKNGTVDYDTWLDFSYDFALLRLGIIYRTEEEAKLNLKKDYKLLTGKDFEEDSEEEYDE